MVSIFTRLEKLLKNSYSPFSNYQVASIVVTHEGEEFEGTNVESVSYGATICAERNAIFSAASKGLKPGSIKEVHLLARNTNNPSLEEFTIPCGICRQIIFEWGNDNCIIYVYNLNKEVKSFTKKELLPNAFTGRELRNV